MFGGAGVASAARPHRRHRSMVFLRCRPMINRGQPRSPCHHQCRHCRRQARCRCSPQPAGRPAKAALRRSWRRRSPAQEDRHRAPGSRPQRQAADRRVRPGWTLRQHRPHRRASTFRLIQRSAMRWIARFQTRSRARERWLGRRHSIVLRVTSRRSRMPQALAAKARHQALQTATRPCKTCCRPSTISPSTMAPRRACPVRQRPMAIRPCRT